MPKALPQVQEMERVAYGPKSFLRQIAEGRLAVEIVLPATPTLRTKREAVPTSSPTAAAAPAPHVSDAPVPLSDQDAYATPPSDTDVPATPSELAAAGSPPSDPPAAPSSPLRLGPAPPGASESHKRLVPEDERGDEALRVAPSQAPSLSSSLPIRNGPSAKAGLLGWPGQTGCPGSR